MGHSRDTSKKRLAEMVGGYTVPALVDAEEDSLRAEFAGLDLTDEEQGCLASAWQLRRRGAPNADLIASRAMFARVRLSLANALETTIRQETKPDDLVRALAVFDRDEAARRQAIEVALLRPITDGEHAKLTARLNALVVSARQRRQEVADTVTSGGKVSRMRKSEAMRIHSRDGLASLFESGRVSLRQYNAGRSYRIRYEAVSHGLRSCLGSGGGGSMGALDISEAHSRLATWERQRVAAELAVVRRIRDEPTALRLLRHVAGEGHSITSAVGSGRANQAGIDILKRALDVCLAVLPPPRD